MKNRQELIEELIIKFSFSALPPFLQEQVLNQIDNIADEDLAKIIAVLDEISKNDQEYMEKADAYLNFYKELSQHIESKLLEETIKMQEELLLELAIQK